MNINVKCKNLKRLFDASPNSRLRIKIKCNNKKICPFKQQCSRATEVVIGKINLNSQYRPIPCLLCNKRIFDASEDSDGNVQIKCEHCGKVIDLHIVDITKK